MTLMIISQSKQTSIDTKNFLEFKLFFENNLVIMTIMQI